jgi:hypothetical protein
MWGLNLAIALFLAPYFGKCPPPQENKYEVYGLGMILRVTHEIVEWPRVYPYLTPA